MDVFGDLFTSRQLVALTTFSDLVGEVMPQIRREALSAGLMDDGWSRQLHKARRS
jgi:putative DNA methylase